MKMIAAPKSHRVNTIVHRGGGQFENLAASTDSETATLSQRQASHPANPSAAVGTRITGAL